MDDSKYVRKVQTTVTNFLHFGDYYLFLKRSETKRIDPGKLNGIGGRVEPAEDFLNAAIRETEEETGYIVTPENIKLSAIVRLEGGYEEDYVMCFFKIRVDNKNIPIGSKTEDGDLIWLHKDEVLDSEYELVDDLNYCFTDIVRGTHTIFMNAQLNDQEKIYSTQITKLPL